MEIRIPYDSDPLTEVAGTIDRVKWALMVAMNRDVVVHELATVVRSASGHARDVLHRGAPNFGINDDRASRAVTAPLELGRFRVEDFCLRRLVFVGAWLRTPSV
jgi:hypothetical protein